MHLYRKKYFALSVSFFLAVFAASCHKDIYINIYIFIYLFVYYYYYYLTLIAFFFIFFLNHCLTSAKQPLPSLFLLLIFIELYWLQKEAGVSSPDYTPRQRTASERVGEEALKKLVFIFSRFCFCRILYLPFVLHLGPAVIGSPAEPPTALLP